MYVFRFIGTSQNSSTIRPLLDLINEQILAIYAPGLPRKNEKSVSVQTCSTFTFTIS